MSSVFTDPSHTPDDTDLASALGPAMPLWTKLLDEIGNRVPSAILTWKHYAGVYGWQLKALKKKKSLLYLVPHRGSFLASMALNDAAVQALHGTGLPSDFVAAIETSRKLPEGRGASVEVRETSDLDAVLALLTLKTSQG